MGFSIPIIFQPFSMGYVYSDACFCRMVAASGRKMIIPQAPFSVTHRIHGAAIYGNIDPINIAPLC